MKNVPGIAGRVFSRMGREKINVKMISQGVNENNISFIVDGKNGEKAVRALHDEFRLGVASAK
jgi:aspartate kinase